MHFAYEEAERTCATILAEGVETEQLDTPTRCADPLREAVATIGGKCGRRSRQTSKPYLDLRIRHNNAGA
jgi:hypothetical protein